MLSPRAQTILKSIVGQYIVKATPVPSHSITRDSELNVSSATIRNEMAHLEQEGYISRPHTSAGSVPLDKGYRSYVASLGAVRFPLEEQRLVDHLFHQVEQEIDGWLNLAATLTAQMVQNVAVVTVPSTESCQFKHLELVSLQGSTVLVVLVLHGAKVRQQLINYSQDVQQSELTGLSGKLSAKYSGMTGTQIKVLNDDLTDTEQMVTDCIVKLMDTEDNQEYEEPYLDGLHFTLNQPELARNHVLSQTLTGLIEQRNLVKNIVPSSLSGRGVEVIIGKENDAESIRDYSVVISQYGLPEEAEGNIFVIGPTRMPYGRTIATVGHLSQVLSRLVARLYGRETLEKADTDIVD
ncbi:heat-inducible transcriptional repressor HrcA [Chloroflexota bacterium]